jgi:RNA polymerase sigma-70 factor (ECF subfamily)
MTPSPSCNNRSIPSYSSTNGMDRQGDALGEHETDALAIRAAAGDAEAFGQLYDRCVDRVYRYVYYRLGNQRDAEDVTEQVFLNAWRAIGRFRADGAPAIVWLLRIAQNAAIDHLRTRKQSDPLDAGAIEKAAWSDPVAVADRRCTLAELREAILELKPEQQQVILMRFIEELGYPQVAAAIGKTEGAVRVIQHRALAALRQALSKERV